MAPVLSRSLTSVAAVPFTPSFPQKSAGGNRVALRSAFLPRNGLRSRFSSSGLKWKLERRDSSVVVRCEASAVAEKEAPESEGETHEYQAEVDFQFRF